MTIRFDDRVAIVTGAGNGLGRSHALALAARGAKVVINDLGGARDGSGASSDAALNVVEEIKAAGGTAMANGANVAAYDQVKDMVKQTINAWGRIDILVNNAGILRDKTFAKMEIEDFARVMDVHVMGSMQCTKAVWGVMREQSYGRIAMTTSSSGLYGNFGQANYGAAKMALIGLMNTLHLEGQKYHIHVNALAPCAATRMTEELMPEEALSLLTPEAVSAGLLYLVSEKAPSRTILDAGAGTYACTKIFETTGVYFKPQDQTPENIAAHWSEICDTSGQSAPGQGADQTMKMLHNAATDRGISLG